MLVHKAACPQDGDRCGTAGPDRHKVVGMGQRTAATAGGATDSHDHQTIHRTGSEDVPLVVTADLELLDHILAAAAAAGIEPSVTSEPASIRPVWATAPMVVVGIDRAEQVFDLVLPRRSEVYVVGTEQREQDLWQWSAAMAAAVVSLPSGAGGLTAAIADLTARPGDGGSRVAVIGSSGGVGTSTIAAGLGYVAASRNVSAILLDLDPTGGGIDLLVGAEAMAGWRWPRLSTAQGHLGDLTGHLPRVAGMDVLSTARDGSSAVAGLEADPVRAVVLSASRSHRLTVADLPRSMTPSCHEVLRWVDRTLLVVAATVRGIAAAQQMRPQLRLASSDLRLIVRTPRSGGVSAGMVSDALELPLAGTVGEDSSLGPAAERGEPPGRSTRGPIAKLGRRLLDDLIDGGERR